MKQEFYDVVIIGTSPVCMIEALYLHLLGKKVVLIDKSNVPGGAWKAINAAGLGNVDIGCHIMNYNKKAFDFLKEYLDVKLIEMNPQPGKLAFGMKLPYDSSVFKLICFFKDFFLTISKKENKFHSLGKHLKSIVSYIIRPKMIYMFPQNGAYKGLVLKIHQLLEQHQIPVILEKKVEKYIINGDKNIVELGNGVIINTNELVVSSGSELPAIEKGGDLLTFDKEIRKTKHLLLVVKDESDWDFEYYQVWQHPIIDRVNNYTPYIDNHKYPNVSVKAIVALINDDYAYQIGDDQRVMDFFTEKKVMGQGAQLLDSAIIPFIAPHRLHGSIEEINEVLSPDVRALITNNLAYSLNQQIDRWSEVIPKKEN